MGVSSVVRYCDLSVSMDMVGEHVPVGWLSRQRQLEMVIILTGRG